MYTISVVSCFVYIKIGRGREREREGERSTDLGNVFLKIWNKEDIYVLLEWYKKEKSKKKFQSTKLNSIIIFFVLYFNRYLGREKKESVLII